jgi:hypothetical protein
MSYKEILKRAQWSTRSGSKSTMSNKEIPKESTMSNKEIPKESTMVD